MRKEVDNIKQESSALCSQAVVLMLGTPLTRPNWTWSW